MQNPELKLAFDFVQYTNRNLFLTGKAGTGKTTFLHNLRKSSPKRMVVVAPTGVAAINAGGVTIHSFFQLPFGPILPGRLNEKQTTDNSFRKFNKKKINIIRSLDLLVIDEISMVRADLLDGIDQILRRYKDKTKPFGGAQLLLIGDLQQLAPVVKEDEWQMLREYYDTFYFFSSKAFRQSKAVSIELKHIYRQQDDHFIKILNEIRNNRLSRSSVDALNQRFIPGFKPEEKEGYIILTTHNATANRINSEQLKKMKTKPHTFEAEINGLFPDHAYPADELLTLKKDAQVMFIKNDSSPEKRYFNGKIGSITGFEEDTILVQCEGEDHSIEVKREMWDNVKYTINNQSKEIEEEIAGQFIQFPLRLAWAITIHKSQGLTFDKAVIDAKAAFAHGQTYVALSRCKSLEGLVLSSQISTGGIICDPTIGKFTNDVERNQPDEKMLHNDRQSYTLELLEELFNFRQLEYHIKKGRILARENVTILQGNLGEKLDTMLVKGTQPLHDVAAKFILQLRYLSGPGGSKEKLDERIRKGAHYFYEQIENHIFTPYRESSYETDNKGVRKMIDETLQKIAELLTVKRQCLSHCKTGLVIKEYLKVRAMAALEKPQFSSSQQKSSAKAVSKHPGLYERLRQWRNMHAEVDDVPVYRVISQRAMLGLSEMLPGNNYQMLEVKGLGKKKLQQYGDELLEIIQDYCNKHGLAATLAPPTKKHPKKSTKDISLSLYKEGKTIEQIAEQRQLTANTIEGHLAHFVRKGELNIHEFVEESKLKTIADFFNTHPEAGLGEAKAALDETFTWGQLRLVQSYLLAQKEN